MWRSFWFEKQKYFSIIHPLNVLKSVGVRNDRWLSEHRDKSCIKCRCCRQYGSFRNIKCAQSASVLQVWYKNTVPWYYVQNQWLVICCLYLTHLFIFYNNWIIDFDKRLNIVIYKIETVSVTFFNFNVTAMTGLSTLITD